MMTASRPGSVTFVAVLTYINAIFAIVGGIIILIALTDRSLATAASGNPAITGWTSVALGVITLAVAYGLLRGSGLSRTLVTVIMLLSVVNGVIAMYSGAITSGVVSIVWALVIIGLLFTTRANEFFRS